MRNRATIVALTTLALALIRMSDGRLTMAQGEEDGQLKIGQEVYVRLVDGVYFFTVKTQLQKVQQAFLKLWRRRFDGPMPRSRDFGGAILSAPDGTLFVAGISQSAPLEKNMTLLSYSPAGWLNWSRMQPAAPEYDPTYPDMRFDSNGNIVIAFTAASSDGASDVQLVSYDTSGELLWDVRGGAGVRAQAVSRDGRLVDDFRTRGCPVVNLRAFHDEILSSGALPLDILERRLLAWIAARKGTSEARR